MPLYEYPCLGCGRRFEALRRLGASASDLECPDCGRSDLEKEYSTFGGSSAGSASTAGGCAPGGRFT